MRLIYNTVFILAIPLILLRLWLRGRKLPAYRKRWAERFGSFKPPHKHKPYIWVHTVSVGEFIAAKPMLDHLLANPHHQLVITTMTPTGSERVRASYGDKVFHVYAPYDIPFCVSRFLSKLSPVLAIFLETELWPNTLQACHQHAIPTLLANARLSEKSARGYAKFSSLTKPMLQHLTMAAIQNPIDAQRFIQLGLDRNKANVIGSIKFDIAIDKTLAEKARHLKSQLSQQGHYTLLIAASTHKHEDEIVLDAFAILRKHSPNCRLILVPRHPDRFDDVYQLIIKRGYQCLRRNIVGDTLPNAPFDILLGDTMGEMMLFYGCADIAFVGGSFVDNGGHNTIEPAVWQLPILSGPSQFNFADIARMLKENNAITTVHDAKELAEQIRLLFDEEKAKAMGMAAYNVAKKNQGALQRLLTLIDDQLTH